MTLSPEIAPAMMWLATFYIQSTAIVLAIWGIERLRGFRSVETAGQLWRLAAIVAVLAALPSTMRLGAEVWTLPVAEQGDHPLPAVVAMVEAPNAVAMPASAPLASAAPDVTVVPALNNEPSEGQLQGADIIQWFAIVWIIISTILLGQLVRQHRRALLAYGVRQAVDERERTAQILRQLADRAGLRCPPRLTVSSSLNSPVCLIGGEICIPAWTLDRLTDAQLEAMLAHELAHYRAGDPMAFLTYQIVERIFFFQPLFHLVFRRLRSLAELRADAVAADLLADQLAMADTLLVFARQMVRSASPTPGAAMVNGVSDLRARIRQLIADPAPSVRWAWPAKLGLAAAALIGAISLPHIAAAPGHLLSAHIVDMDTNAHGRFTHRIGTAQFRAQWQGRFARVADGQEIIAASDDAWLTITATGPAGRRTACITLRDGAIVSEYRIDGQDIPLGAADEAWIDAAMVAFFRVSGLDAAHHVRQLLRQGGFDSVAAEMSQLSSDYAFSRYLAALSEETMLNADQISRLAALLPPLRGEGPMAFSVVSHSEDGPLSGNNWQALLSLALDLPRAADRQQAVREMTRHMQGRAPTTRRTRQAFEDAARTLFSSGHLVS